MMIFLWICSIYNINPFWWSNDEEIREEELEEESKLLLKGIATQAVIKQSNRFGKIESYKIYNDPCGEFEEKFIEALVEKTDSLCDLSEDELLELQGKAIEEKREKVRWENRFKKSDDAAVEREIEDWLEKVFKYCREEEDFGKARKMFSDIDF